MTPLDHLEAIEDTADAVTTWATRVNALLGSAMVAQLLYDLNGRFLAGDPRLNLAASIVALVLIFVNLCVLFVAVPWWKARAYKRALDICYAELKRQGIEVPPENDEP